MASHSRRQVVTVVSIVFLILITALSGYASSRANRLYIPIPGILQGFTTALPIISGFLLEGAYDLTRVQERRHQKPKGSTPRPPLVVVANTIIFIYSTVVITLLGTHVAPPSGSSCALENRWNKFWTKKNTEAVRAIQEVLGCCGFVNSHDRAWPFPDKSHDIHACEKAFGNRSGCREPWKAEEQGVAGIFMAVIVLVFVWQILIIMVPTERDSWLHQVVPDRVSRMIADQGGDDSRSQRAVEHLPTYHDDVVEEFDEDEGLTPRAVEGDVQQLRNALSDSADGQHNAVTENEWARG